MARKPTPPGPPASEQAETGIRRDPKSGRILPGGASLNPTGRPKSKFLTRILLEELEAAGEKEARQVVRSLIDLARTRTVGKGRRRRTEKADVRAIGAVFDRIEGKVPLAIEHSGSIASGDLTDEQVNERIADLLSGKKSADVGTP